VKRGRKYRIRMVNTITETILSRSKIFHVWEGLQSYVESIMLSEPPVVEELIIIGEFSNDEGVVVTHSSAFVRLMRKNSSKIAVPVLVYLDFNFPRPYSTHPSYLDEPTDLLKWKTMFAKYQRIEVFRLEENYTYGDEFTGLLKFTKSIINCADELQPATVPSA
jgi:hypothetical protein